MHNLAIFIKGGQGADYFRQQVGEAGILEMVDGLNDTLITEFDMTPEQLTKFYEMINRIELSLDKTVNDPRTRKAMNMFDFASTMEKPTKKPGKEFVEATKEKPAETKEEKPVETTEEKPVETTEEKPVETTEEKPAETKEEKPVETKVETTEEKPVETTEEKPVETTEEKPVETTEEKPADTTEEKPVETTEETTKKHKKNRAGGE